MACPHCRATFMTEQAQRTALGYRTFRCQVCKRLFNERTGTPFNFLEYPTDIILLIVVWRVRYKLSLRDLAGMFLTRSFTFTHEAVREWEARLHHCWRSGCAPSVMGEPEPRGTRTRPMSTLPGL